MMASGWKELVKWQCVGEFSKRKFFSWIHSCDRLVYTFHQNVLLVSKHYKKDWRKECCSSCTNHESENVKVGDMLNGVFPNIYWTPWVAHCINLMLRNVFKKRPFTIVFTEAVRVHSYIVQRLLILSMMRRFTKKIVKLGKTRFSTAFLTLHSMHMRKANFDGYSFF